MKKLLILLVLLSGTLVTASESGKNASSNFFSITLSASKIDRGQTLTVFVTSAHRLKQIELSVLNQTLPMYHMWHKEQKHLFRAFAGIPIRTRPGSYKVVAKAVDMAGDPLSIHTILEVADTRFKIQRINLSKKKTKLLNYKQLQKEGRVLAVIFKKRDPKVYFATPFRRPSRGRISSGFGWRRQYNGKGFSSHHKGLDIANKTGTPVYATNGGRVSIAVKWKSHGKTILINHGHGIVSAYIHMHRLLVKKGEWVRKGQLIGRIGSTGIATGPHLHFGISVNNVRIDPDQWIRNRVRLHF